MCSLLHIAYRQRVIIDDDLMLLPVAFSWGKDISPRILQHRDEVGGNDGLRKQVFTGAEEGRTLPLPLVFCDTVIDAVTGPNGEMTVIESTRNRIRS